MNSLPLSRHRKLVVGMVSRGFARKTTYEPQKANGPVTDAARRVLGSKHVNMEG